MEGCPADRNREMASNTLNTEAKPVRTLEAIWKMPIVAEPWKIL